MTVEGMPGESGIRFCGVVNLWPQQQVDKHGGGCQQETGEDHSHWFHPGVGRMSGGKRC